MATTVGEEKELDRGSFVWFNITHHNEEMRSMMAKLLVQPVPHLSKRERETLEEQIVASVGYAMTIRDVQAAMGPHVNHLDLGKANELRQRFEVDRATLGECYQYEEVKDGGTDCYPRILIERRRKFRREHSMR